MNRQVIPLPFSLRVSRRFRFPRKLGVLERLFGDYLKKFGTAWVETAQGCEWKLDLSDPCHRWIVFGYYEGGKGIALARAALESAVQKNGAAVYVDSGANIGQWLLYLGHIDKLKTYAFEPIDSQRHWLEACLAHQNEWQVRVFDKGLSRDAQRRPMRIKGALSTLSDDWYQGQELESQTVELVRLDKIMPAQGVDEITFWKLDVEGHEYHALLGAFGLLERQAIHHIFFECHPLNYHNNLKLLEGCGYDVFDISRGTLTKITRDTPIDFTQDLLARPRSVKAK